MLQFKIKNSIEPIINRKEINFNFKNNKEDTFVILYILRINERDYEAQCTLCLFR